MKFKLNSFDFIFNIAGINFIKLRSNCNVLDVSVLLICNSDLTSVVIAPRIRFTEGPQFFCIGEIATVSGLKWTGSDWNTGTYNTNNCRDAKRTLSKTE